MKKPRLISPRCREAALGCVLGALVFGILTAGGGMAVLAFRRAAQPAAKDNVPVSAVLPPTVAGVTAQRTVVAASPTVSLTPFQPRTYTPTPSITPTATATATATPTPTPTSTYTPLPTNTPIPTDTPVPPTLTPTSADGLPAEAGISGVNGYAQALPLSCESRSAVDWARFFGVSIRELDFQSRLPVTDNPNTGFVGSPRDERGSIPPDSYGVHPPPVARLLRAYGINAQSRAGMEWQDVRREIASGEPVIAWVVGNVWTGFYARSYTASDGETLLVVPFEHTVIVTGYTPDFVSVVDNDMRYSIPLADFLESWAVLGNFAVVKE